MVVNASIKWWVCVLLSLVVGLAVQAQDAAPTVVPASQDLYQMGIDMLARNDIGKAREVFARAIAADPNNWQAMLMRGQTFDCSRESDATNALKNFNAALEIQPEADDIYLGRGNCYQAAGNSALALEDYAAVLRLNPGRGTLMLTSIALPVLWLTGGH